MCHTLEPVAAAPLTGSGSRVHCDAMQKMTAETATAAGHDWLARRNAVLLALAQACVGISVMTVVMIGGLAGNVLADNPIYATLPVTFAVVGSFLASAPASLLMQRFGRRPIFMLGVGIGAIGGLVAAKGVLDGSFFLLCLGTGLAGIAQGTATYFRFAAADNVPPSFRPKAISWVLAGGVLAALLTPEIIGVTKEWLAPAFHAGIFLGNALVLAVGVIILAFVRIPRPASVAEGGVGPRPLSVILAQPRLLAAIASGAIAYAMMSLVMTATPLAMVACSYSDLEAADTIRWHVLAMYGPSFFTGNLIAWIGRERIVLIGLVMLLACAGVALAGIDLANFKIALVLLGLGWNFGYIGATTIVAECHTPAERGKVQGLNDATVFGCVALASFLSGNLHATLGWDGIHHVLIPVTGAAIVLVVLLMRQAVRKDAVTAS